MVMKGIVNSKKGWIKLVEVFLAVLLLAAVLLVVVIKGSSDKSSVQEEISKKESAILRDIELNDTLREDILSIGPGNLPVEWNSFASNGIQDVRDRILSLVPSDLDCEARLCLLTDACIINEASDEEVYAKSVVISADLDTYSPRQLKLFCTKK